MYKLLSRQLKRNNIDLEQNSDLLNFVQDVANTYTHFYQEQIKFEDNSNKMLSKIRHTNENLKNIIATIDSFNYHLSHDLKTSSINNISLTRMLKKYYEKGNDKKVTVLLDKLESNNETGFKLIENYLKISKFENQIEQAELLDFNIPELCNKIHLETNLIDELDINIIQKDFETITIDEISIRSILQNFMTNAYKYAKKDIKPVLNIRLSEDDLYRYLSFEDNGIGIDLEKQGDKVFKPFVRIQHNDEEGSGIGLFIVKKIVNNLGGNIEVESEINKGTTFTVKILK